MMRAVIVQVEVGMRRHELTVVEAFGFGACIEPDTDRVTDPQLVRELRVREDRLREDSFERAGRDLYLVEPASD